jgi:hypothetical protein
MTRFTPHYPILVNTDVFFLKFNFGDTSKDNQPPIEDDLKSWISQNMKSGTSQQPLILSSLT